MNIIFLSLVSPSSESLSLRAVLGTPSTKPNERKLDSYIELDDIEFNDAFSLCNNSVFSQPPTIGNLIAFG